jgi:hypothetical protein
MPTAHKCMLACHPGKSREESQTELLLAALQPHGWLCEGQLTFLQWDGRESIALQGMDSFLLVVVVLGCEFRALHLQNRCSTTLLRLFWR